MGPKVNRHQRLTASVAKLRQKKAAEEARVEQRRRDKAAKVEERLQKEAADKKLQNEHAASNLKKLAGLRGKSPPRVGRRRRTKPARRRQRPPVPATEPVTILLSHERYDQVGRLLDIKAEERKRARSSQALANRRRSHAAKRAKPSPEPIHQPESRVLSTQPN